MRAAELRLTGESRSAPLARRFLSATLSEWDCADLEFAATLLLSELVTNAVLHAKSQLVVRVAQLPHGLRLEVADHSSRAPATRRYDADATTGRGLALVESLAHAWGVTPTGDGKIVWCEITEDTAGSGDDTTTFADLAAFSDLDDDLKYDDGDGSTTGFVSIRCPSIDRRAA